MSINQGTDPAQIEALPSIPPCTQVTYPGVHGLNFYTPMLGYLASQVLHGRGHIGYIPGQGIVYYLPLTAYDRERFTLQEVAEVWIVIDFPEAK